MIEILKRNHDETFDIVSENEIVLGDEFVIGFNPETKVSNFKKVDNIIEQRKERGTYKDESKRRFWAKIS